MRSTKQLGRLAGTAGAAADEPLRVLVTGANSTVAQSIIKALKASRLDIEIFGSDINPYSPGLYRAHRACLVKPFTDPDYDAQMRDLLANCRIDALMPGIDAEVPSLARRKAGWEASTGCRVIVSPPEVVEITYDKFRTARFLAAHGCNAPDSVADMSPESLEGLIGRVGLPLVIKPRRGSCSRDLHLARTRAELFDFARRVPNPVVQQYLDSDEYTCGVFVDARGVAKGVATLQRSLGGGITMTAIAGEFPDVAAEARRVALALGVVGPCNVQLRRDAAGRPTTFEVNARFSSSLAIRAHFGFNEAEAALRSFVLGEEIPEMACRAGVAMRYVNEVYVEPAEVEALALGRPHAPDSRVEANF